MIYCIIWFIVKFGWSHYAHHEVSFRKFLQPFSKKGKLLFSSTNEAYATLVLHEELQHLDKIIYGMYSVWCIEQEINCFGWYFCLAMGVYACLKHHNMITVVAYLNRLPIYVLLKHLYDKIIYKRILNNINFSKIFGWNHIFIIFLQNKSPLNSFKIPLMQFDAAKKIVFPFEMYFLQRRDRI